MTAKKELTVTARLKNLAHIGDFILETARQAGLSDRAAYAIHMAVDEACANIIEHGYEDENRGDIRLICQIRTDGLQVTIYDRGQPFDPAQAPPLDTEAPLSKRQRGMGLFFIHKLADEIEFEANTPQGNRLRLFKRNDTETEQ